VYTIQEENNCINFAFYPFTYKIDILIFVLKFHTKMDKIKVWIDTKSYYASQPYIKSQVFEDIDEAYVKPTPKFQKTQVEFVNRDCLEVAIDALQEGSRPLLLNMSSWFKPGGGVEKGAGAQEEDLFRRGNYHKFLDHKLYPLPEYRTILSRGVEFYKNSREYNYNPMKTKYKIDCIAAPAVRHPTLTSNQCLTKKDADMMRKKINIICQVALKNNNDCLVLSAWGCGAYGCPPEHIGKLFREVIDHYQGQFKKIIFAIIDGTTSGYVTDNYNLFKKGYMTIIHLAASQPPKVNKDSRVNP
jgi:uncharacterized protein (TIGR02452 family)